MIWIICLLALVPSVEALGADIFGEKIHLHLPLSEPAQFEAWAEGMGGEMVIPKRLYQGKTAELPIPKDYSGPLLIWVEMAYCDCNVTLAHVIVDVNPEEETVIKSKKHTGLWIFSILSAVFCAILVWKR